MKNNDRLNILKSLNISVLSTKDLKNAGLTANDIVSLTKDGIIKHVKRGEYELVASTLDSKEESAYSTNYELFYNCILKGDYQNSISYLAKLYEETNFSEVNKELNLYTYLLNFVIDLPLTLISYTSKDMSVNEELNEVVILIKGKKFHQALNRLRKEDQDNKIVKICISILETIANEITSITEVVKTSVFNNELVKAKEILEQNEDIIYSNMKVQLYLINIILAGEVPKINYDERSYNFMEAINNNDFKTAIKFHLGYIDEKRKNSDVTYILLEKIINILNSKKQENSSNKNEKNDKPLSRKELLRQQRIEEARKETARLEQEKQIVEKKSVEKQESIPSKEELQVLIMEDSKADILTILNKLMNDNNMFANMLLKNYLKELGKEEYEFLISDLIKISYLEKDYAFLKPISTLAFIARDKFCFNLGEYIEEFYMNLANNNFEIAYLYLDIIENARNIGVTFDFVKNLRIILKNSKEKYEQEYGDLKLTIK